jgi:hypothetical protein
MKTFISSIFLFLFSLHAFAWDRYEIVDDFSGKKSVVYLQKSSNNSGGYLIINCENKVKIAWDYDGEFVSKIFADSPRAPAPAAAAMPPGGIKIMIKTDEDSIHREMWSLASSPPYTLFPKSTIKFLTQIKNKSVLRLKSEQPERVGVFDISELNKVASDIKAVCN